jgi:hypothetical protein
MRRTRKEKCFFLRNCKTFFSSLWILFRRETKKKKKKMSKSVDLEQRGAKLAEKEKRRNKIQ